MRSAFPPYSGVVRSLSGCCSGEGPDLCDQVTLFNTFTYKRMPVP